jgi:hypothetical protein
MIISQATTVAIRPIMMKVLKGVSIHQELFVSLLTMLKITFTNKQTLKNNNYALRAARPRVADRPAGG